MNISFTLSTPGCDHIHVTATVGAQSRTFTFTKQEFALDPEDQEAAVKTLIRHIAKTNNVTTFAGLKSALEGQIFKL